MPLLAPPNPSLFHCAAWDTGRGMAPTCPQTPNAPSPSWGWVGRGLGWSEGTPLLPPRDFAYVARDPLTQVLKCHVFRCEGPASAVAAGLHRVCAQVRPPRAPQEPLKPPPWPAPPLCPSETTPKTSPGAPALAGIGSVSRNSVVGSVSPQTATMA